MAVNTDIRFNNARVGVPQVAGDFEKFVSTTDTSKLAIGHKIETQDGATFRWSHFGGTVSAGSLVATDYSESSLATQCGKITNPASATTTTDGTIGSRYVQVAAGAETADQFAGGTFIVTDGSGKGQTYRIAGNTAADNPASGYYRIEFAEPITGYQLNASTDFIIMGSKYANLESATSATDYVTSGVSTANQVADDLGWIQTKGVCAVLMDESASFTNGIPVITSTIAGTIETSTDSDADRLRNCYIGRLIYAPSTGCAIVDINLEV